MKQNERAIQRKLRIFRYAEEVGSAAKACRYFGISRASCYCWKVPYKNDGEAGLVNKKPIPKKNARKPISRSHHFTD